MSHRPAVRHPWWAASGTLDTGASAGCGVCGGALVGDPDDVLSAPQGPMCGACARAREFDQTLWELDLAEPDSGLW
ncbi:MAG: hypothetical protein LH650_02075 [Chloroflexi bacterium]|nr:hypothetical protein [Chloroflexota bacterium]